MNEQERRELLAEQAAVIHELKRDAAGMSAIIAVLRVKVKHTARPVLPRVVYLDGIKMANVERVVELYRAAIERGEFVALNGSIREEYLSKRFDHEEGQEE